MQNTSHNLPCSLLQGSNNNSHQSSLHLHNQNDHFVESVQRRAPSQISSYCISNADYYFSYLQSESSPVVSRTSRTNSDIELTDFVQPYLEEPMSLLKLNTSEVNQYLNQDNVDHQKQPTSSIPMHFCLSPLCSSQSDQIQQQTPSPSQEIKYQESCLLDQFSPQSNESFMEVEANQVKDNTVSPQGLGLPDLLPKDIDKAELNHPIQFDQNSAGDSHRDEETKEGLPQRASKQFDKKNVAGGIINRARQSCVRYLNKDTSPKLHYLDQVFAHPPSEIERTSLKEYLVGLKFDGKNWSAIKRRISQNKSGAMILIQCAEALVSDGGNDDFNDWIDNSNHFRVHNKAIYKNSKQWFKASLPRKFRDLYNNDEMYKKKE